MKHVTLYPVGHLQEIFTSKGDVTGYRADGQIRVIFTTVEGVKIDAFGIPFLIADDK